MYLFICDVYTFIYREIFPAPPKIKFLSPQGYDLAYGKCFTLSWWLVDESMCEAVPTVKSLVSGALERLSRTGPGALVRCGSIFHPGGTGFRPASTLSTVVAAERALAWESGDSESSSSPALVAPGVQAAAEHLSTLFKPTQLIWECIEQPFLGESV